MNRLAIYRDVALEVLQELMARIAEAESAGIARSQIAIDPGFGFAKNADQSRTLLQRLSLFLNLGCPIIAGLSRKRFVGAMAGVDDAGSRDAASIAAGLAALAAGASVLRVHDVAGTVQAVRVWQALAV